VGAGVVLRNVLRAGRQPQLVNVDERLHLAQVGERRQRGDVDLIEVPSRARRTGPFCASAIASTWLRFIFQLPAISGLRLI
jgi:hypothetical protein